MKIEIWSDFACPFCYIGKRRLEEAVKNYSGRVKIEFKSFELDPDAPKTQPGDVHAMLAKKYGMTYEKAKAMNDQLTAQAKDAGIDFQMDTLVLANTHDAHRLSHLAKEKGVAAPFAERLMKAYFTDSKNIADRDTLLELAEEAGLSKEAAAPVLDSDRYRDNVRSDQQEARDVGVQGVPFFVFNEKYAVSGAQSVDTFKQVLEKVAAEQRITTEKTECCDGDGCAEKD